MSLKQCVRKADFIFVGTVARLEYANELDQVFTRVTFKDLVVVKGKFPSDSLQLRATGGVWNGNVHVLVGYPEFVLGYRYAVCATSGLGTMADLYRPIVYWNQGFFPILSDSMTGQKVIHDCYYRPIVGVENDELVTLNVSAPRPPSELVPAELPRPRRIALPRAQRADTLRAMGGGVGRIILPDQLSGGRRMSEAEFLREVRRIARMR